MPSPTLSRTQTARSDPASGGPWVSRRLALGVAVLAPVIAAWLLGTFRGLLANTSAALIMVLLVVGVACLGYRSAGLVASVSAGLSFNFFLTAPYLTFLISDRDDVETFVVLVAVGVAVNEVVQWGRRHLARVRERDAYLDALLAISSGGEDSDDHRWIDVVGSYLITMLDLDRCAWQDDLDQRAPRLDRDGEVRLGSRRLRVEDDGLPTDSVVVLPIYPVEPKSPGYVLTATTHIARPSLRQRRLAAALADQTRWALAR